ncbi:MAG: tRNA uridine-5-carboxymethylaminomethyl(34) synthesis GTPase MnmE [Gammaproteobacteria bacterium]|nr:tRNA uridine-5-carboxymethylaminomethyl(34) synthesis GTPase MnmE [Gammaproteobacteria bacterium]
MNDTIAAPATAPGRGGIGVIRVSGPDTPELAVAMIGVLPQPRVATFSRFLDDDGATLDSGIALYFEAPASFTGEHVLELQGHGGPVIQDLLMQRLIRLGARHAEAGEFSKRAYLNGKIDLAQAEAIVDLISAETRETARSAVRSLEGGFSDQVTQIEERLRLLRVYCEAAIDFPEEDVDWLAEPEVAGQLSDIVNQVLLLRESGREGALLRDGITMVLLGAPNVGKSSLLNLLTQRDSAIVSETPGTTRDVIREQVSIDGIPVTLLDTAGLRHGAEPLEAEGIRRALKEAEMADIVLEVRDDVGPGSESEGARRGGSRVRVLNKIDLTGAAPGRPASSCDVDVCLSARTGAGIDILKQVIRERLGVGESGGGFLARRRHLDALEESHAALVRGQACLQQGSGELLCEELSLAHESLGRITGKFDSEDLLGAIFSEFCIGK